MAEATSSVPWSGGAESRTPPLWRACLLLAVPFVICSAYILWSGRDWIAFWGTDEQDYHWPLMQWFAQRLPHVDFRYPITATTPLFHLLGACAIRLFGANLHTLHFLRFLNMLVSMAGVFVLLATLVRSRRHPLPAATLFTALFLSSCYFLGYSFLLVTDNLAIVCCLLTMAALYRFVDPATGPRLPTFLTACGWCCLAILTRQSYMFLCLPCAAVLLWSALPVSAKALGLGGLALAVLPFAALVLLWHGLVPPGMQDKHAHGLIHPYALALPLMLLGFYSPFLEASALWRRTGIFPATPRGWIVPVAAALAGCAVVYLFPLFPLVTQKARSPYIPDGAWQDVGGYFAGWIYNVGKHLPVLHGNSLLFWVLLPAGLVAAAGYLRGLFSAEGTLGSRLPVLFLLGLLLASLINGISSQKYYDALILAFLVWHARPEQTLGPLRTAGLAALIALFCGYHGILQHRAFVGPSEEDAAHHAAAVGGGAPADAGAQTPPPAR